MEGLAGKEEQEVGCGGEVLLDLDLERAGPGGPRYLTGTGGKTPVSHGQGGNSGRMGLVLDGGRLDPDLDGTKLGLGVEFL